MADAALRTAPVPAEPASFPGVTIALAPSLARWSVRGRDPTAIGRLIGHPVPAVIGTTEGALACLGPDEWLLRLPTGSTVNDTAGLAMAVTDISERAVGLTLEGDRALEVLASGCPRNLTILPVGSVRRTIYEGVEIVLFREGENRWTVEVWRSFAPWLWTALTTAAAHQR
jgi:sarcosine oxidase subunit gamma